jgi:hypothetical protein
VDELWHAAILDTKLYAELQEALGLVLHHRPSGASDQESEHREKRLAVMKAIYRANFSTDPLGRPPLKPAVSSRPQPGPRLLNPISIFVMTLTGNKHTLTLDKQATIDDVKSAMQSIDGTPFRHQQLYYDGVVLSGGRTLERYGIGNESTLHLYTRPVGW